MAINSTLPINPTSEESMDVSKMEKWLWKAACSIRGAQDAPKFKDFILPLIFFKRLSDVFDDEFTKQIEEFGSEEIAHEFVNADHEDALKCGRKPIFRFYIPQKYSWGEIRKHPADETLGEFITEAMREVAKLNPDLKGIMDIKDFNEKQSGQRILDDERLASLIEVISEHRLGLNNTEPDIMGRAYEYLLRKFAEGQGQSAGEFFTPKEVGWLMAKIVNPEPYSTVYDPTCGSGGLLVKSKLVFEENHPDDKAQAPKLYGQELTHTTFAIAKMNMFLYDISDAFMTIGDTFKKPGFATESAGLSKFNYVVANPMWNQKNYDDDFYENDGYDRFIYGNPPSDTADWGWIQHISASLKDNGRAAVVLDTGAVSRGSGSKNTDREREIRKKFIENDWIEGVIYLPDNLFYNTTAAGIILLLNKNKSEKRKEQILLINASDYFIKEKPKNILTDEGINKIVDVYNNWKNIDKFCQIISTLEAIKADYNIVPSQFVNLVEKSTHRRISKIIDDIQNIQKEREQADFVLNEILNKLTLTELS